MIKREIQENIMKLAGEFPAVAILGPRQSGKTTLARMVFKDYHYVSFEDPDTRLYATEDPRDFLENYQERVIFDEIQKVPDIFSYLQGIIDRKNIPGNFILTGSHNFLLMEKISQSLAGRIGIEILLPFNTFELYNSNNTFALEEYIIKGGYPRIYDQNISHRNFYRSYVSTYIEKDVRLLRNITSFERFSTFLKLIAGRSGQVLNINSITDDIGISPATVKDWLSVLQTSFIIYKLQPYHKNYNKRLIRSPKIYFYDTGLLCFLLGIKTVSDYKNHYYKGPIFETFILSEFYKHNQNRSLDMDFFFWRDNHNKEIDVIIEDGQNVKACEIKASKTIHSEFSRNLEYLEKISGLSREKLYIIFGGEENTIRKGINYMSWKHCYELMMG